MIKFTQTVGYDANLGPIRETKVVGVGTTLYTQSNSERVMSDVWEWVVSAYYWDADSKTIKSMWLHDDIEYSIDGDFDSLSEDIRRAVFNRHFEYYMHQAEEKARLARKGSVVKVVSGRTSKGTVGKVVVSIERPYNTGWRSSLEFKFAIALDDEMTTYTARNGKQYPTHKNVVWVWARNCEVVNPNVDFETARRLAESATESEMNTLRGKCRKNATVAVAA
jgi:hypothetical protein